jgi:hypothetical protein
MLVNIKEKTSKWDTYCSMKMGYMLVDGKPSNGINNTL